IISSEPLISAYSRYTLEQGRIEARMRESGICMRPHTTLDQIYTDGVAISNSLTGSSSKLACDAVVLVTDRLPNDGLYQALKVETAVSTLNSLRVIGDADAPNLIERAVFAGHLAAREFDQPPAKSTPFRIERTLKP
ncbi:MAG: NADH:flavin oxidoreductase, partial [Chloroflexi bacterium]|nr:NADH:flavin oxidoreductase [Chloroflexota bacterium]